MSKKFMEISALSKTIKQRNATKNWTEIEVEVPENLSVQTRVSAPIFIAVLITI